MTRLTSLLVASAVALTGVTAGAAQAQQYYAPVPAYHYYGWHNGEYYHGPRHVVHHWAYYGLPRPPYGCVWVEDGRHFLLLSPHGVIDRVWIR